jgi:nucleoside-triphosphatase THEP1
VATIHAFRHPFTDALKARDDVHVVRLSHGNRDALPERLARELREGQPD